MKIFVNGKEVVTDAQELTHGDVAKFAFGCDNPYLTITYRGKSKEGILTAGESVTIGEGMRFTAVMTSDA